MTEDEANFRKWFADALSPLRGNGDAGFVFALVAFPLLERYLREKSGTGESLHLNPKFYDELGIMFPEIKGHENDFWQCYRNGLLHQVAFSSIKSKKSIAITIPSAGISGHDQRPVYRDSNSDCFYLNPKAFFDVVTKTILTNFPIYEGSKSPAHPLPRVPFPREAISGTTPTVDASYLNRTGNYK